MQFTLNKRYFYEYAVFHCENRFILNGFQRFPGFSVRVALHRKLSKVLNNSQYRYLSWYIPANVNLEQDIEHKYFDMPFPISAFQYPSHEGVRIRADGRGERYRGDNTVLAIIMQFLLELCSFELKLRGVAARNRNKFLILFQRAARPPRFIVFMLWCLPCLPLKFPTSRKTNFNRILSPSDQ